MKFKLFNNLLILTMILTFSLFLASGCSNVSASKEGNAKKALTLVNIKKAEVETKKEKRRFTGYTHPWKARGVGFLVAGRITSIRVNEGDFVKKGALLATIDQEDYKLVKKLAETQLEAIEPNYERVNSLVQKDALPESELDIIKGKYVAALTQKKQAERQVNYTRLYAPASGVVHELKTSVGQVIGQGSPAVILLQVDKLKAKFGVTQHDLGNFELKKEVNLDFPGVTKDVIGKVFHIDYVADKFTKTYNVVVEVDNKDKKLRASMVSHMNIVKSELEGFFVPITAINRDIDGNSYLMTVEASTSIVNKAVVKLGKRYQEEIQIEEGLKGGESIIVKGNNYTNVGDKVAVQ